MTTTAASASTSARRCTALVALVLAFLATIVAVGARVDAYASTATAEVDGNAVAAHEHVAGPVVEADPRIAADQGRVATTPDAENVSGSRVALSSTAADSVGSPDVAYRGLAEGEDIASGLTPRAPGATNDIVSHVAGRRQSQWMSATRSEQIAREIFGQHGVVAINLSRVSSEVVDLTRGIPGLPSNYMFSRWAAKYQEVVIRGHVPPEAIWRIQ